MQKKIERTKEIIRMVEKNYRNPIIMSGFGKDSICVVHLCRSMGYKWPVMFHRDPFFPKKYKYANQVIELWDLVCYDYPARSCSIFWDNGVFEVARHYQIGGSNMILCAALYEPNEFVEGEYLCALKDIYLQPKGSRDYPWDCILQGFRYTECKPHSGMTPAKLRWHCKHNIDSVDSIHPIRDWTNQETYQYVVDNNIPVNTLVYDVENGELIPKKDNTYNPDRRPACYRCMLPSTEYNVLCPKKNCLVNNVWPNLIKTQMPNDFAIAEDQNRRLKEVK